MYVLGIESTCDETAAAIVEDGRKVISNVISTSVKEQALYGGVVPEIASRRHAEYISATVDKALADAGMTMADVDAVAVTFAPGLIGAVLVGVNFAKGLAYAAGKPLVPVHHLRGHIAANYLTHQDLKPPFLCLVASGGHSHIVLVEDWCRYKILGRTVDDAAGEAYDKVARTLGLPYPGGPSVAAAARDGNPKAYKLPVPHVDGKYNVSFSGLKTAVINEVHNAEQKGQAVNVADMAASFQERIDQILAKKLLAAAADTNAKQVVLAGGEFRMTAEGSTWHGGEILGKPRDRDDARRMLKILSGAHHLVTTGVTLRSAARMTHFTSLTYVWFRTLTDEEIAYYVDTFQPFDKAGAYGIQEWIGYAAIERIEGSFYNVMGLPVQKVYTELDKFLNP